MDQKLEAFDAAAGEEENFLFCGGQTKSCAVRFLTVLSFTLSK